MKRDFLKGLELSDEAIDQIMAEHGKSLEKYKADAGKVEGLNQTIADLQGQLQAANTQIEEFKGMDIDGIRKAADEWKEKAEQAAKDAEDRIVQLQFDHALDAALAGAKAKNAKAVRALLDVGKLAFKDGEIGGLSEQLDKIKADNDYLFESDKQDPKFASATPGAGAAKSTQEMTYSEMVDFLSKNPNAEI